MAATRILSDSTIFQSHEVGEQQAVSEKVAIVDLASASGATLIGTSSGQNLQAFLNASLGPSGGLNEVWLSDYYPNDASTDDDALQAFAAAFNAGTLGNVLLKFSPSKGRGNLSTGNYFFSQEVLFTGSFALEIDGQGSVIRQTAAVARLRYAPPPSGSGNVLPWPWFVVKNFCVQYAASVDTFAFWDIPYVDSRLNGTGYIENVRMAAQDVNTAAHTANGMARLRNTWAFTALKCHHSGKPRIATDLVSHPEQVFLVQQDVCILTSIISCEINYVYQPVTVGVATLTGINGSYAQGAGTIQRGVRVVQGTALGYVGRSDGGYGYTWSLYNVTGTFADGSANVYDYTGTTLLGTINITSTAVYQQASEAINFDGGTGVAVCSFALNWTKPALVADNLLNIVFGNCHFAPSYQLISANGISALAVSDSANFLPEITNGNPFIDINNGYLIHIGACTASNNGATGTTFCRLRNTTVFSVSGPKLTFFANPVDIDNSCKDGEVRSLVCDQNVGPILNTANRYNGTSNRGVRFYGNGVHGLGIDIDDPAIHTWTPVVTSSVGAITSSIPVGYYVYSNGIFSFTLSIQITTVGTASGKMYITLPSLITTPAAGTFNLYDSAVTAYNTSVGFPIIGLFSVNALGGADLRGISLSHQNPAYSAFANYTGAIGNYNYIISGAIPLRIN